MQFVLLLFYYLFFLRSDYSLICVKSALNKSEILMDKKFYVFHFVIPSSLLHCKWHMHTCMLRNGNDKINPLIWNAEKNEVKIKYLFVTSICLFFLLFAFGFGAFVNEPKTSIFSNSSIVFISIFFPILHLLCILCHVSWVIYQLLKQSFTISFPHPDHRV